jgi:glycosyltransferase involved in cell wall biosynthesis
VANILVLGVKIPFNRGGADALTNTLVRELKNRGHDVDTVELPLAYIKSANFLSQAAIWRNLELEHLGGKKVDLVIGTKFPTYYAKHPKKSLWLIHQHRAAYELHGTRYSDFSDDARDEALRQMIIEGDTKTITECKFISGISRNVMDRLERFNGIRGAVLYPPLPLGDKYRNTAQDNYILSVGRLCNIKRIDLMIKAMPMIHQSLKLKIVGTPDEAGVLEYFKSEISKHHLEPRVEFLGKVSDEDLLNLYARALAVYYAPFDEDYGYVTLEAMASSKPVITAVDSGGTLEFVKDMENGLVVAPNSEAVAAAVNKLVEDPSLAAKLGSCGRIMIEQTGLNKTGWDLIIEGLLSPLTR